MTAHTMRFDAQNIQVFFDALSRCIFAKNVAGFLIYMIIFAEMLVLALHDLFIILAEMILFRGQKGQ